jgi:hypothetical protein
MSPNESNPDVQRAVEYLEDSDEPLDSKVSVVTNAANSADIPIDTILSEYADRLSAKRCHLPDARVETP